MAEQLRNGDWMALVYNERFNAVQQAAFEKMVKDSDLRTMTVNASGKVQCGVYPFASEDEATQFEWDVIAQTDTVL